jgi:hypothetical protein
MQKQGEEVEEHTCKLGEPGAEAEQRVLARDNIRKGGKKKHSQLKSSPPPLNKTHTHRKLGSANSAQ